MKKINLLKSSVIKTFIVVIILLNGYSTSAKLKPIPAIPDSVEKAYIGVYLMNLYDMDESANSFYADFYLWCKWKGEINPLLNIDFINCVEKWGFTKEELYDTVQVLSDGFKYNALRVEGRFYHSFLLHRFPLDKQSLDIQIENSIYTQEQIVYLPLDNESGISDQMLIPGWAIIKHTIVPQLNEYQSNFGNIDKKKETYSNLTFSTHIERPLNFFVWKLLLPLIIVLISSLGTTLIFPGFIDARISLPIGALLAAVFLQQSYTSTLPDVGYMVLMDKIYVLSYILIIAGLVEAIRTANFARNETEEEYIKVKKYDFKFITIAAATYVIGCILIIIFS